MFAVSIFVGLDALIVKYLSSDLSPILIVFTRALFGLPIIILVIFGRDINLFRTKNFLPHLFRAILKIIALVMLFFALAKGNLSSVTTISFTSPFFVILGAMIFFSEKPHITTILALLLGFTGIFIVLNPSEKSQLVILILALSSAISIATIQLILKHMGKTESAETLVFWNLFFTIPITLIPAIYFWQTPNIFQFILLILQGLIGVLSQYFITRALQLADASLVAPIEFVRLPFVSIAAYFIFGEVLNVSTIFGAILIFLSILLIAKGSYRL